MGKLTEMLGAMMKSGGEVLTKTYIPSGPQVPKNVMLTEQPEIPSKTQDRPNWDPNFSSVFTDFDGKINKAAVGKPAISNQMLFTLATTDPITASIISAYKDRITGMNWAVVPDIEHEKSELLLWEKMAMLDKSKYSDPNFKPLYENHFLPNTIANPLRKALQALDPEDPMTKGRVRWLIDKAELDLKSLLIANSNLAETKLRGCNNDAVNPFNVLLERILSDLCTFDAMAIGGTFTFGGELEQLYTLPAEEIKIYKNPDWSTPVPPHRAYAWELAGQNVAEFTTDDLLYASRNPQKNGYGFSPIEMASYMITSTLYADAYNMDAFKADIPPALLNLGKISPEQRERFKQYWRQEVTGKTAGLHRVLMTNFAKEDIQLIPLRQNTQEDMQMMEYLEWGLLIKCMCFGISPQEIGFTKDLKYETSTNQLQISNRGVDDMALFIETIFTEGILKNFMGLTGVKFILKRKANEITKDQATIASTRVQNGLATQNEIRDEWGQRPLAEGGDIPYVTDRFGQTPVAEIGAEVPSTGDDPADPSEGDFIGPDELDAAVQAAQAANNVKPTNGQTPQQAQSQAITKSLLASQVPPHAVERLAKALKKKLGIDSSAPGGPTKSQKVLGAKARRNTGLRKFKTDIKTQAAALNKAHVSKLKSMLGDK